MESDSDKINANKSGKDVPQPTNLHILFVTQAFFPTRNQGGRPVKVRALAHALSAHGHKVTVLTARHADEEAIEYTPTQWGVTFNDGPVTVHAVKSIPLYRSITFNPQLLSFSQKMLGQIDVVHIFGLYDLIAPIVALLSHRRRLPYVIEPCGMFRPISRNIALKKLFHRLLIDPMVTHASKIISTATLETNELLDCGLDATQIGMRRNGCDPSEDYDQRSLEHERSALRLRYNLRADERLITFLGTIVHKKGLDLLLTAIDLAQSDYRFIVAGPVGDQSYYQALQQQIEDLGLDKKVTFIGPIFGIAKNALLLESDLHILPSRNENFGNVVLEAAALGVPSIITDRCGAAEVAYPCSEITACSAEALSEAISRLSEDSIALDKLREATSSVTLNNTWENVALIQLELYQECVAQDTTT